MVLLTWLNEMVDIAPKLNEKLEKLSDELRSIHPNPQTQNEVNIMPFNGLRALLTQIQNRDSEYSKAALTTKAGQNAFQNVLRHYNAIALWLGFTITREKNRLR